jgi:predicted Zn-dependent protease with MMP-like domain
MSKYKTIYTEVEVDVDISEFSTDDLLDELASRSSLPIEEDFHGRELLEKIWMKRRVGNSNYQEELDRLIYEVLGYVV